jgi:hypothetical protein
MLDGNYLAYDDFPGSGIGTQRLVTLTAAGVATRLQSTSMNAAEALKNTAGTVIGSSSASIHQAWQTANGDIFWVAVSAGNVHHLFRAKAATYTVGSDAGYSNKQAVLDIGLHTGVHSADVRSLSTRSFLEATVNGVSHLFFAEYNVSSGRTSGVGGAGHDQTILYRSTNGGQTWTVLLEFNTAGSHVLDHFHAVIQDPGTKLIYVLSGDQTTENSIIMYDGVSAAPAANSTLAVIHATPGWKVLSGSELHRYTDLSFSYDGIYGFPDADQEASDTTSTAFVSTYLDKTINFVSSIAAADRYSEIAPYINVSHSELGHFCVSFRTQSGLNAGEPYLWVWHLDENKAWKLIAKLKNHRAVTGTPRCAFFDGYDLFVGASYKSGVVFWLPDVADVNQSSTIVLRMRLIDANKTSVTVVD